MTSPNPEKAFTDDDLKRLKEILDVSKGYGYKEQDHLGWDELVALLARLEAAERCLVMADQEDTLYEDWKRAAGK